jgi:hypothetical protein
VANREFKPGAQFCNRFVEETDDVANAENPPNEEIVTRVVLDASRIAESPKAFLDNLCL